MLVEDASEVLMIILGRTWISAEIYSPYFFELNPEIVKLSQAKGESDSMDCEYY